MTMTLPLRFALVAVLAAAPALAMDATPAPLPFQVLSDPHIQGFNSQTFDFTGEPGKVYAFISDTDLVINTLLSRAFSLGVSDAILLGTPLHETSGTWIARTGWVVSGNTIVVSVEGSETQDLQCGGGAETRAGSNCMLQGSVELNGEEISRLGEYSLDDQTKVTLTNSKTFSRVAVVGEEIDAYIDVVLPPKVWNVDKADVARYSHINLSFNKISLSYNAHGVLGQTVRTKLDVDGKPIVQATDANGAGIIEGQVEDYEVPNLLSVSEFVYSQHK